MVPGTPGPVTTVEEVKEFVKEHGMPIILKAAFGGGGRGMRIVRDLKVCKYFRINKVKVLCASIIVKGI